MRTGNLAFVLSICLTCSIQSLTAQKHDYHWVIGYGSNQIDYNIGGTNISFHSNPPDTTYVYREMDQGPFNNNISDEKGNLQFYTNGCEIAGADDLLLLNGDSINTGQIFESYCDSDYPVTQGGLILPDFSDKDQYHFFHLHGVLNSFGIYADALWYSMIDMKGDNGQGEVVLKNKEIVADTLWLGQLTATRHANGRDWWIVTPYSIRNKYHSFLFSPEGITEMREQDFINDMQPSGANQAVFSPDGSHYIRFDRFNKLQIFDFDRCTGTLSNPVYIDINLDLNEVSSGGVAVSPNSRYLYVTATIYVYQFDLEAGDIASSQITVAEYDGYASPFGSTFYLALLCPDGKIYINTTSGENVLHVIHKPDKPGLDCDFRQHDFKLPTYNQLSVPNFPNYRLGPLAGSACDTLVSTKAAMADPFNLNIYPNPAQDVLHLSLESPATNNYHFSIIDVNGRILQKERIAKYSKEFSLNIKQLNTGLYYYQLSKDQLVLQSGKFLKIE